MPDLKSLGSVSGFVAEYGPFGDMKDVGPTDEIAKSVGGVVQEGAVPTKFSDKLKARFGNADLMHMRYLSQSVLTSSTVFAISNRHVLAVVHRESDPLLWERRRLTFDHLPGGVDRPFDKMWQVEKVVLRTVEGQGFALLTVDGLPNTLGLKCASREEVNVGQWCGAVGHPFGLPKKRARPGEVVRVGERAFECRVDAMVGSSGSPILDENTGKVVGVLVSGHRDLVAHGVPEVVRAYAPGPEAGGERCVKIHAVLDAFGM